MVIKYSFLAVTVETLPIKSYNPKRSDRILVSIWLFTIFITRDFFIYFDFYKLSNKNLFDHKHCSLANRSLSLLWISLKRAAWKKIRVHHWRLHLICTEILHRHINSQLLWGLFHTEPCSLQHLQFSGFCLLIVWLMWC